MQEDAFRFSVCCFFQKSFKNHAYGLFTKILTTAVFYTKSFDTATQAMVS